KGTTFDVAGNAMATNNAGTEQVLARDELQHLPANIRYFIVGRHVGLLAYYFPGLLIAMVWLVRARRSPLWQAAIAFTLAASIGALIIFLPDSWNGGGGPPGNRYFLSIYPIMFFLMGPAIGLGAIVTTAIVGLSFVGAMVAHPFAALATP